MAEWVDVTATLIPAYFRPVFDEAGTGFPGSTVVVVNPAGPWSTAGTLPYAIFRGTGDRDYIETDGVWIPDDSTPELYLYDSVADPDTYAPGVLGLTLPTPLMAYGARLTYKLPTSDVSGSTNMVFSIPPNASEGTISSPPESMTPPPLDDPWSADDALTSWAVVSPFTNDTGILQVVERTPSAYLRPVAGIIASIGGFTGPRETFDVQAMYLEVHAVELFMDAPSSFWTDFLNTREV